jgi:hypothetical protein
MEIIMEKLTLQQFVEKYRRQLNSFESRWRLENSLNPNDFPMQMYVEDWYEQFDFIIFSEYIE